MSRVRFVRRRRDAAGAFLFEITTGDNVNWRLTSGSAWTLMNLAETDAFRQGREQQATQAPDLSARERIDAMQQYRQPAVEGVSTLDETLRNCVPAGLQESGLLVVTGDVSLAQLHQLQGFPLSRLADAIRSAAERDHWTTAPATALLPRSRDDKVVFTDDEQRALAQSRVRRLLAFLPEDESRTGHPPGLLSQQCFKLATLR